MSNNSTQRTTRVKKNVALNGLAKGLSLVISFLYVPLLLHSMDTAHYGVWLTLTSLVSWISIFDIGLGNGLRNRLGECLAKDDYRTGRVYVSTSYVSICAIGVVLVAASVLAGPFVDWNAVLNAGQLPIEGLGLLAVIVLVGFCLNFVLSLINSVLHAMQKSGLLSLLMLVGQTLTYLIVLFMVKAMNISSLLILGSVISLVQPTVLFIFTVCFFSKPAKRICPSLKCFDASKIRDVLSLGLKFFLISIITIILYYSNNLILTQTMGPDAVVTYNIAYKYMYISVTLFAMICVPIWSAATEAYIKKDLQWIMRIKHKLLRISGLFVLMTLLQVLLSRYVFKIWIGADCPEIGWWPLGILVAFAMGQNLYASYGYILNGIGKVKVQMVCSSAIALLYIPVAFYSSRMWGLNALLVAMAIVPWLNFAWASMQYIKILTGKAKGIWNE